MLSTNPSNLAAWHTKAPAAVLQELGTSLAGLSSAEAVRRFTSYGRNELREADRVSLWKILAGQFQSLIVWILIIAGAVSGILGEWVDAIAILAIVLQWRHRFLSGV